MAWTDNVFTALDRSLHKNLLELKPGFVDIQPRSNNKISSLIININNHPVIERIQQYNHKEGFKE